MKLKKREEDKFFSSAKGVLKKTYQGVTSKRFKISFLSLIIVTCFFMGIFFGIIFSGFFGTFDNPSQNALEIAHNFGITNLRILQQKIKGALDENIMIPINYIKGQFSNPERIYIDIDFEDYEKIEYKRQEALDIGFLFCSGEDYVPATIKYNGEEFKVKLRLKGDGIDHLKGDKWSFRIKVEGDETIFGMKTFSIQRPETRDNLNEFVYHKVLRKEGVIAIRYDFIEVVINGKNKGIYAIEEHFAKELLENNDRREAVILKFNADSLEESIAAADTPQEDITARRDIDHFYVGAVESFDNEDYLSDPIFSKQFEEARNLLESFRTGKLKTSEVFDVDKLSKFFAVNTLFTASHASKFNNIRFYYNPITSRIEPIGFDALPIRNDLDVAMVGYFPPYFGEESPEKNETLDHLFFNDEVFYKAYIKEVERVSHKEYLDEIFSELDKEINKNVNIIHKEDPLYHFPKETIYRHQEKLREKLNPIRSVDAYLQENPSFQNKVVLEVGNIDYFPLEIESLTYNDSVIFELNQADNLLKPKSSGPVNYQRFEFVIPSDFEWNESVPFELSINYRLFGLEKSFSQTIIPWPYTEEDFLEKESIRQESNLSSFEFLDVNEQEKIITFNKKDIILNESLVLPAGYEIYAGEGVTIDLINNAKIISYSNLQFIGTNENPIQIISSDNSGQGLAVINAHKESLLEYVYFKNLRNPSEEELGISGAITFYESSVKIDNVKISGMTSEDSINLVRTKFDIENAVLEDCGFDCIDVDFGDGIIRDTSFIDCGNDCLDFSGSTISLEGINILNPGDKGISVGEKSDIVAENIVIEGGYIGVASKDLSKMEIHNIKISKSKYGFAVYQKKPEFGPSEIDTFETELFSNENDYVIEKKSNFSIDDSIVLSSKEKVYEELYPV